MKQLLISLTSAAFIVIGTSSNAALLLYEPFNYTPGERLGGSGTSPLGKVAPNGQRWITRSPAPEGSYVEANDTLITAGNLSYPGLAPSSGNSVRYGSATSPSPNKLYTDAIAIPDPVSEGTLYYSAIVRINNTAGIPTTPSPGVRTSFAAFSSDPADPLTDAGVGVITASGTGNIDLPAGAWIRNSGSTQFQFGSGKSNSDGMGPSASKPSWQSSAAGHPYPNQQGNTAGTGQDWATISSNIYFIVMKYTFDSNNIVTGDTVSMWINPVASTLGDDAGEALAGASGGSYYSAVNATVTATTVDASQIRSFLLIGLAQSEASFTKTIDISLDELRIGTTWADVTPIAPPPAPKIVAVAGAGTSSVTVTWTNALVGTNYILQYKTNLSEANWSNLAPVMATGSTASQTDQAASGAARFFRVLQQ